MKWVSVTALHKDGSEVIVGWTGHDKKLHEFGEVLTAREVEIVKTLVGISLTGIKHNGKYQEL